MAMSPIGVVVLLLDGEFLWLAERTAADRPYFGYFAAPGGSLEDGEALLDCAKREVFEETGLSLHDSRLIFGARTEHTYDNGQPFTMFWFSANLWAGERPVEREPHKQGKWLRIHLEFALTPQIQVTPGTDVAIRAVLQQRKGVTT